MAYDKHTWTCDEPITVERLNHIEDGIANAGGGECGFECETTITLLTEESVTTTTQDELNRGVLSYSQLIDAEVVKVTFNGTEYECPRIATRNGYGYGGVGQSGPDFSEYPFAILSGTTPILSYKTMLFTETAGTYTIKIEAVEKTITTTPCFDKARGYSCDEAMVTLAEESVTTQKGKDDDYAHGDLAYSQLIDAETIKVTFNGTEYECPRANYDGGYEYGASWNPSTKVFDWSEYPFNIYSHSDSDSANILLTETAGTYSVKIEALETNATITPCFEAAVKQANINAGTVSLPKDGVVPIKKNSSLASQYTAYANSPLAMRMSFFDSLSELAVIREIVLPDGVLLNSISLTSGGSARADLHVYNVSANDIAITDINTHIEVVDFEDPDYVCAVMSSNCSSPGPSPK